MVSPVASTWYDSVAKNKYLAKFILLTKKKSTAIATTKSVLIHSCYNVYCIYMYTHMHVHVYTHA